MAITTTKFDSGWQTTFDQTGSSPEVSGRQLIGHITFAGAVGEITVEARVGGAWTALGAAITSDLNLVRFNETILRDYRFRFRCSAYTSGTITANYTVAR